MDACTVTALDAITAFAVPDPNGSSQSPSVFSGPGVQRITSSDQITQPTSDQLRFIEANPFARRCECNFGYALAANSCEGANHVEACTVTPLMRSLLSQSLTPTAPRRVRRFFRVRASNESLHWTESPSLLQISYGLLKPTFSAINASDRK